MGTGAVSRFSTCVSTVTRNCGFTGFCSVCTYCVNVAINVATNVLMLQLTSMHRSTPHVVGGRGYSEVRRGGVKQGRAAEGAGKAGEGWDRGE
jgi:hypothetical protein